MPRRRKTALLPADLRHELDRRLVEGAFSNYRDLSRWLEENGHAISKSALHGYGQELERRIERIRVATEQAEALVAAAPDDNLALADASIRMAQEQIYTLLYHAEGGNLKETAGAARALAETVRASLAIHRDRRHVLAEAADAVSSVAKKKNLSEEVITALRAAVEDPVK